MNILLTGIAGFIGYHFAKSLLKNNSFKILGIDNINDYYDTSLKLSRLHNLGILEYSEKKIINSNTYKNLSFVKLNLEDNYLEKIFETFKPDIVIHLAAQAGARYSLINPFAFINSNIYAFVNILECIKKQKIKHLFFASSSSVYGTKTKIPFSEKSKAIYPTNLYAATKRSDELIAYSFHHIFKIPTTILRFFTVYGPWGRPDMSIFIFTDSILKNKTIELYNYGNIFRDFTYIDDVVLSFEKLLYHYLQNQNTFFNETYFEIFNIGGGKPVKLTKVIKLLEKNLSKKAIITYKELPLGDLKKTHANNYKLKKIIGHVPFTPIEVGIKNFVSWYKNYFNIT